MDFSQVRPEPEGLAAGGNGFVERPLCDQGGTEIVIRLRGLGLDADRLAAGGDRFVKLTLVTQGVAEVVVRLGKIGP